MWIKALYPDFSYCALVLLISADGLIKWKNVKKPRPLVTLSAPESFILKWNVLGLFSTPAGVKDSNEAELLAIVKTLELSS